MFYALLVVSLLVAYLSYKYTKGQMKILKNPNMMMGLVMGTGMFYAIMVSMAIAFALFMPWLALIPIGAMILQALMTKNAIDYYNQHGK